METPITDRDTKASDNERLALVKVLAALLLHQATMLHDAEMTFRDLYRELPGKALFDAILSPSDESREWLLTVLRLDRSLTPDQRADILALYEDDPEDDLEKN